MGLLVEHNSVPLFIDFPLLFKYLIDYSIATWERGVMRVVRNKFWRFWHI